MHNQEFYRLREKNLNIIKSFLAQNDRIHAMKIIAIQAVLSYQYNQFFFDAALEDLWKKLLKQLPSMEGEHSIHENRVLWYDAFGLGNRGLAYIYLQALDALGYEILYVSYDGVQSHLTRLKNIINQSRHKTVFLPKTDFLKQYKILSQTIVEWGGIANFLYTTPSDVVGIAAFEKLPHNFKRYQVNLTDHAYWLGTNSFDVCIDFRSFGASISYFYRKISKEKIKILPYYPTIDKKARFKGFPFEKTSRQKVLFSGGSIYKTLDKNGTFYQIVSRLLNRNKNLIFWYAGDRASDELKALQKQYGERVIFTTERDDLYQVLQHVDVYLNTYPVSGGLMLQYAALAGRIPFTLLHDDEPFGMLLNNEGVYYRSRDEMISAINRYLSDDDYRTMLEKNMSHAVITPENFTSNLQKLLIENKTEYPLEITQVDVKSFQQTYIERWEDKFSYRMIVAQKDLVIYRRYLREITLWVVLTLKSFFLRK